MGRVLFCRSIDQFASSFLKNRDNHINGSKLWLFRVWRDLGTRTLGEVVLRANNRPIQNRPNSKLHSNLKLHSYSSSSDPWTTEEKDRKEEEDRKKEEEDRKEKAKGGRKEAERKVLSARSYLSLSVVALALGYDQSGVSIPVPVRAIRIHYRAEPRPLSFHRCKSHFIPSLTVLFYLFVGETYRYRTRGQRTRSVESVCTRSACKQRPHDA